MENKNSEPLASEIYHDLKNTVFFLKILVVVLVALLAGTNFYHIYQWSQFDTIVVETSDSGGHANYVQGDNTGGIYNGESGSPQEEGRETQGDQDQNGQ